MTKRLLSVLFALSLGLFCCVGCGSGDDDDLSQYDMYLNFMTSEYKGSNIEQIINNEGAVGSTISFLGFADEVYDDTIEASVYTPDDFVEVTMEYNSDDADIFVEEGDEIGVMAEIKSVEGKPVLEMKHVCTGWEYLSTIALNENFKETDAKLEDLQMITEDYDVLDDDIKVLIEENLGAPETGATFTAGDKNMVAVFNDIENDYWIVSYELTGEEEFAHIYMVIYNGETPELKEQDSINLLKLDF